VRATAAIEAAPEGIQMTRRASPRRALSVLLAALTIAAAAPAAVFAVDDTTPPMRPVRA